MLVELFPFQQRALAQLRQQCASAHNEYESSRINQVVSFTAPTGAGKTIIASSLIESILFGDEKFMEQPDAIIVWLSDSPQLNQQSREKIETKADKIRINQCVTITEESFDKEILEDGTIYFLNTQKLSKSSNLTKLSDNRQHTIWETLANTINEKSDRLYFIIDEAHRGMKGNEAGRATSIMQKFILGSPADGLPAVPVSIGMSATIERFNQLVKNSSSTIRPVKVTAEEVRASGLLKDRVIITYPTDLSEQKDMAVLQAATDEWMAKCNHWETYCREQHLWMVKPIFVVQVLNGSGDKISETDLDDCLQKIEHRSGVTFAKGEVVHAFGETKGSITINGLEVPYEEPSKIADNKMVRLVFFKETLSTGWDCPRAETMMSFRRYVDATAIAQLLGRMVRTPMQKHIMVDDMLNDVRLFLPHFDSEQVGSVVDELQNSEGGELPTDVIEDEFERGSYVVLTSRKTRRRRQPDNSPTLFDNLDGNSPESTQPNNQTQSAPETPRETQESTPQDQTTTQENKPSQTESHPTPPAQSAAPQQQYQQPTLDLEYVDIDTEAIVAFINDLALPTYHIRTFQMNDYLKSLFRLADFLSMSGLDTKAKDKVFEEVVEKIHNYILGLKSSGKYAEAKEKVLRFEMLSKVYDAFGKELKSAPVKNLFSELDVDLDRQLRVAEKILGDAGISWKYGVKYDDVDNLNIYKIDVIIFAGDENCMKELHEYAKAQYHALNDKYRYATTKLSDNWKTKYRDIVRDSAEITQTPFCLSENIAFKNNEDGKVYTNHLFVDEVSGQVKIKLNGWETIVINEEQKKDDFRCWYRNPSRGKEALSIPYDYKGTKRLFYPDFFIIRKITGEGYILDILEPHDSTRDDNVGKAKALAKYAEDYPCIGRAQLIRIMDSKSGKVIKRLDFAKSGTLREKVSAISSPEELDLLFTQYGAE